MFIKSFFNEFFEKKPLLIKDAISYGELLFWEKINEVLPRCNIISEDAIKLMYKGQKLGKKII